MQKITNFLMFTGQAEDAMNFYTGLFKDSAVTSVKRNPATGDAEKGTIMHATFTLNGQPFMCIDSPPVHQFTFTPSMSLYITCESEEEIDGLFGKLSEGGSIMMPLAEYPFSKRYAWLSDRFGVSWQLSWNG